VKISVLLVMTALIVTLTLVYVAGSDDLQKLCGCHRMSIPSDIDESECCGCG
jgi:hypothetical protein